MPVQRIDEVGEVVGRAEPRRRGEVADRLVAPASVERMLGDRQQLDVGEVGVLQVRDQLVGQLAIVEEAVALLDLSLPRAEMDLVDRDRLVEALALGPVWPSTRASFQANLVTSQTTEAVLGRSSAAKP